MDKDEKIKSCHLSSSILLIQNVYSKGTYGTLRSQNLIEKVVSDMNYLEIMVYLECNNYV